MAKRLLLGAFVVEFIGRISPRCGPTFRELSMHVTNELFLLRNGFQEANFVWMPDQLATLLALFVLLIAKKARSPIL